MLKYLQDRTVTRYAPNRLTKSGTEYDPAPLPCHKPQDARLARSVAEQTQLPLLQHDCTNTSLA
jgi:hypothetical protein